MKTFRVRQYQVLLILLGAQGFGYTVSIQALPSNAKSQPSLRWEHLGIENKTPEAVAQLVGTAHLTANEDRFSRYAYNLGPVWRVLSLKRSS